MATALDPDELLAAQLSSMEVASIADALSVKIAPDSAYVCPVCKCLLENPMQTPCGHLVCRGCLERLWREWDGPVPCPGQQDYCDMLTTDNVFPDKFITKQIVDHQTELLKQQFQGVRAVGSAVDEDTIACPECGALFTIEQLSHHLATAHSGAVNLNEIAELEGNLVALTEDDNDTTMRYDRTDLSTQEPMDDVVSEEEVEEEEEVPEEPVGGARRKVPPRNQPHSM